MGNLHYKALPVVLYLAVATVILGRCQIPVSAAEKLVGPDGKVLYYLHDDGRVSDPSGRTKGYLKEDRYVDPSGRTKGYYQDDRHDDRHDDNPGNHHGETK